MSEIKKTIKQFQDNSKAILKVPNTTGNTPIDCVLTKTETLPSFKLLYSSGTIQTDSIQYDKQCHLIVRHGEGAINLKIKIDKTESNNALICTALTAIQPEELREFFRVMINVPIRASYQPGPKEKKNIPWTLTGKTIDISGGGVLAVFPGKPPNNNHIQLELGIPGYKSPILCQAKVINTYRLRQKRYQVAFCFERIEQKIRDIIISCCLQEQRRQLRENIRV